MGKVLLLVIISVLTGCGCDVSKGDMLIDTATGEIVQVLNINSAGAGTDECTIAIRRENGFVDYWIYAFKFKQIGKGN